MREVWFRQIADLGKQFKLMIRLENVLKTSLKVVLKISWRHLEEFFKTSWRRLENVLKTSCKHLEDVLKTHGRDEYIGLNQDFLKTSWRRLLKTYEWEESIPLDQDLLKTKTKDVFKTFSRHLHQEECLLGKLQIREFYI